VNSPASTPNFLSESNSRSPARIAKELVIKQLRRLLLAMPLWLRWLSCLVYAALIMVLSLLPAPAIPSSGLAHTDKLLHFVLYGGLAGLLCWTLALTLHNRRRLLFAVVIAVAYGSVMELAQLLLTSSRFFSWADIVANSLGAIFFVGIYALLSTAIAPG